MQGHIVVVVRDNRMNDIIPFSEINLVTLNQEQLQKIISRLPILHKSSYMIGHATSQTSYSLQTMTMISDSPLSRIKQIMAQISSKYQGLREAHFKVENMKLEIKELLKNNDEKSKIKIMDNESLIHFMNISMENTLREIGMFQDMYDSIMKNNNIPENWTEKDFESQEISNMIKSSFRIAIQDLTSNGRVGKAAVEFWEQLGIHPQMGEQLTREYMVITQEILNVNKEITIQLMFDFLDEMAKRFKESYKLALTRMGLDAIGSEEFMADGVTKPQ